MGKLIMAISFLSANFMYQYMQDIPDYTVAAERTWFQAFAMVFIIFYPKLIERIKSN